MNIEGTYTLQAPPEEVWHSLMDQKILLHTIPGVESVERVNEDTYDITVYNKNTPFKGTYRALASISEQQFPYHYRLTVEGQERQNLLSGTGSVHLNGQGQTTVIAYKGTLSIKLGALLPTTLIKGATKLFIQQYFQALADYLRLNTYKNQKLSGEQGQISATQQQRGNIVIIPPPPLRENDEQSSTNMFTRVARLLRLGGKDREQQQQWGKRIQRIGFISSMLFLIWVGTRIPPRHRG